MLLVAGSAAQAQTTDIALGIEALARREVRAADAAFARAVASDNPTLKPLALQWRADVAWRLRGDTGAARRFLDEALGLSRYNSQVLLEMARLQGERRRYREATRTALQAASASADAERRGFAMRALVSLAVDGAFAAGRDLGADSVDRDALLQVRDTLLARTRRFHGRTTDALAVISAGVLLADSTLVEAGLDSYLALRDPGLVMDARRVSTPTLAGSLASAGLYEQAALALRGKPGAMIATAWLADVPAYADFLRGTRRAVEASYRASLAGTARPGDVSRALNAQGRRLWRAMRWPQEPPPFYPAALTRELAGRFGAVISIERNRGIDELHFAHRLGSYQVTVDGRAGTVVVLDGTVSNGIDAWLLDGTGGRAGWVSGDTIYSRRTGFTETPFRALVALTDPQSMPGEELRLGRDSIADIARARRDSLGFLPGVAARVFRAGAMAVLDSLRGIETMTDREREAAFARALFESLTASSIVLHESRHLGDARSGRPASASDREFRAKVEEVIGAPRPRLALTAILVPNIGDPSPHGRANRRIMMGLASWIRQNGDSIAGYDPATPALLHLPSLTDPQLIEAFRGMRKP